MPAEPHAPVSDLPELDPVIHAQVRLRVMTALCAMGPGDRLAFPRLQDLLDMTAGNLSTHLRRLEEAGYVGVDKTHRGRKPTTWISVTARGRRAFETYHDALQAYVGAAPTTNGGQRR